MVLNIQTECDRLVELIGKNIDELSYKVDDLTYKFIVVESCLVIRKKVSSSFVQREQFRWIVSEIIAVLPKSSTLGVNVWNLSEF